MTTAVAANRIATNSSPLPKKTVAKKRSSRSPYLVADYRHEPKEHDAREGQQVQTRRSPLPWSPPSANSRSSSSWDAPINGWVRTRTIPTVNRECEQQAGDAGCPGGAHPSGGRRDYRQIRLGITHPCSVTDRSPPEPPRTAAGLDTMADSEADWPTFGRDVADAAWRPAGAAPDHTAGPLHSRRG